MELSEKQKAAHKLASDYLYFLTRQEEVVGTMLDRKWEEIKPLLEQMIDERIREYFSNSKQVNTK